MPLIILGPHMSSHVCTCECMYVATTDVYIQYMNICTQCNKPTTFHSPQILYKVAHVYLQARIMHHTCTYVCHASCVCVSLCAGRASEDCHSWRHRHSPRWADHHLPHSGGRGSRELWWVSLCTLCSDRQVLIEVIYWWYTCTYMTAHTGW